ncbi:hypothetical protein BTVI_94220 [Pitangus sulphuratus]|nr:hypothetical protein BTVI_94220 [Pitangus sulphuratus]
MTSLGRSLELSRTSPKSALETSRSCSSLYEEAQVMLIPTIQKYQSETGIPLHEVCANIQKEPGLTSKVAQLLDTRDKGPRENFLVAAQAKGFLPALSNIQHLQFIGNKKPTLDFAWVEIQSNGLSEEGSLA